MKIFQVDIIETSCRSIYVQAETLNEAEDRAEELYDSQEIILDYEDYEETQYKGKPTNKTPQDLTEYEKLYA